MEPFITTAYAQAAEATGVAVKAADTIISTGVLGALFALGLLAACVIIVVLWRALKEEQKGRREDNRVYTETLKARDDIIYELQEKRNGENKDWADRVATGLASAASAIATHGSALESVTRIVNAILEQTKTYPPAIEQTARMFDNIDRKLDGIGRDVVGTSRGR